ncbi:MAG: SDR family oxidoreductase [Pseudomonas sp.]|uniref:SDR family NAD(P)-dependent oxidoreductase n=1 Tax=Pseudomonas sp. TaxID=306 RepID=UPI0011FC7833|nr:SDR family NAD(P)-dependent oxidoreductase [Pseudomonas sp.]RZI72534.1 MAG: SDR family oxidoreductase [Pseudomonas sp.]
MTAHSLFDLTGRVVVATGGNSGIGFAFLKGCARQGADVVIWDRDQSGHAEASELLRDAGAGKVHVETVDVSNEGAVVDAFASTVQAMGRVDCVLANAGFTTRASSFMDLSSEMYHQLLDVNLHGAFYTLREAARHMRDRALAGDSGGSIVVTGSLSIFHGLKGMEHYAGAKGALAAMVKGLAVELGEFGVRANMLAPGFIMTGMTSSGPEAQQVIDRMAAITPLGRPGYLSDIEGPAAYLASDASAFQTGDILVIDGGRRVKSL